MRDNVSRSIRHDPRLGQITGTDGNSATSDFQKSNMPPRTVSNNEIMSTVSVPDSTKCLLVTFEQVVPLPKKRFDSDFVLIHRLVRSDID